MTFPGHDRLWTETAAFVADRRRPDDLVLAPDLFWWRLEGRLHRWVPANLDDPSRFDWIVVHKGEVAGYPRAFLAAALGALVPVFANPVFVVLATPGRVGAPLGADDEHQRALRELVAALPERPAAANPYDDDAIFGGSPTITRFVDLDDVGLRREQERFFGEVGGYRYPTARDRGYFADVHRHVADALGRWRGLRVLDLASASVPLADAPAELEVVRVDFARNGLAAARRADADRPGCRYACADAHHLPFAADGFDAACFVDAIEHVRDAEAVLFELGRVVRPGGELLLTFANRNSVNQVLTRALGRAEFVTNHQHFREFTIDEITAALGVAGFDVAATAGVLLLPYWGVPGIDEAVRPVTDDDPEVVAMMRLLGERVGVEHAYTGVVVARRR